MLLHHKLIKYVMKILLSIIIIISTVSCNRIQLPDNNSDNKVHHLIQYVNPFIGTKNMGHTFPGASAPFGMVQLSPETNQQPMFADGKYNTDTYKYCSGYQYADSTIFGFSHTHFSGTGHSDLGDFLIMPTTGLLELNPGKADCVLSGYHSTFDHKNEHAEPGYYKVKLDKYNIGVELTASERVGFHQYTFPETDSAHIILDMTANIYNYDGKNIWTFIRVENDTLVTGYRQTKGWARTKKVFFAMTFSKPITSYGHEKYDSTIYNGFYRKFDERHNFPEIAGKEIRAYFDFTMEENEQLKIKFALSSVSTEGALINLQTEIPHWDFNRTKNETQESWNNELSSIIVETFSPEQLTTFYTALYHTLLSPVIYEDVDGRYRGLDQNIYNSEGFTNYTIFSLWDTYRALHPLYNLIKPRRNNDMIKSMLAHHDQSVHKALPVWSHYSNENWCMVGYHSVSVLADAIVKNTTDVDVERALNACINSSTLPYYDGLGSYINLGYVPEDLSSSSVSKTLEYAYDDWCIAQIALKNQNVEVYDDYLKRSRSFQNIYNSESGYMQPKLQNGNWRSNFDPIDTHGQGFIEGNAWNYGLYVPHDIDTMISMMGGKNGFSAHLDRIFTTPIEESYISKNEDITRDGIIGNYVHGNEPGHHIPYLYNWTDHPWKTQERVRMIMDNMYGNREDGLCGNDDAGQMSAWYIFSALGFYPVTPASDEYALGCPLIKNAIINLGDGKFIEIIAKHQGPDNIYVDKVTINGKEIKTNTIKHSDIMNGGKIIFQMSNIPPNKQ
jgi:predicted alpha-1,2-mannosidase